MVAGDKTAQPSKNGIKKGAALKADDQRKKSMHMVPPAAEKSDQEAFDSPKDTNTQLKDANVQQKDVNVQPTDADIRLNNEVPPEGLNAVKHDHSAKHIHPCVCDLTAEQRRRIKEHHERIGQIQRRFEQRVREIEEELERLEEERLEREREMQEHQELFGDEYEMIGKKKKRKKRAARRASMVSLGVKQIINWKDEPKIKVKYNNAFKLRCDNQSYCSYKTYELPSIKEIQYNKVPNIPVRVTKAYSLRSKINWQKCASLVASEDKRPMFLTASWY